MAVISLIQVARSDYSFGISGQQLLVAMFLSFKWEGTWRMNVPGHSAQPQLIHLYNIGTGGVDQAKWTSRVLFRLTVHGKKNVLATEVLSRLPHYDSHFLVHCEIEENCLSHLIFGREVSMLSQDGSTKNNNCKGTACRLVEQNLPLCQMEFRDTVTANNSKQGAMHLKEMQSVQKECTTPIPKVWCKDSPW